jgi:hypothetical protein
MFTPAEKFKMLYKIILFIKPLKMDLTEGSETSAKLNLTPGVNPKENTQHALQNVALR